MHQYASCQPQTSQYFPFLKTGCPVLQEGLELLILLLQPSEGWGYKSVPLRPVYVVQDRAQDFVHGKQALSHRSYIPMPLL